MNAAPRGNGIGAGPRAAAHGPVTEAERFERGVASLNTGASANPLTVANRCAGASTGIWPGTWAMKPT